MPSPTISVLTLAALPLGALAWTLAEYVLHKGFHTARGRNYGSREHLLHHGSTDNRWLSWFLSWAGVAALSFLGIPFAFGLVGSASLGWGLGPGYALGYAFYEVIHFRAHNTDTSWRYELRMRRHHFIHHFVAPMHNHGVTTTFWDRVFGTHVEIDGPVRVPRRLAMAWLLDDHGDVVAHHRDRYAVGGRREQPADVRAADMAMAFANEAPSLD